MADIHSRTEIGVTTGPIRGSRKIHVATKSGSGIRVAMREIVQSQTPTLFGGEENPPITVYDPRSKGAVAYTEIAQELLTHAEGRDAIIDTEEGVGSRTGRATAWWRKRPGS